MQRMFWILAVLTAAVAAVTCLVFRRRAENNHMVETFVQK